jgi:Fe2+ transport system protein FeoA
MDGSVVPLHKRLMDLGIGDGEVLVVEPADD